MGYLATMKRIEANLQEKLPKGAILYYRGEADEAISYEIDYTSWLPKAEDQKKAVSQIKTVVEELGGESKVFITVKATFPVKFSEELKSARAAAEISQSLMSSWMSIPKRTIESWETGVRKPPYYVQNLVLDFLYEKRKK